MTNRILLTGVNGQVGSELLPLLQPFGEVHAPKRSELDLSNANALRAFIQKLQPRWIVNPAAYTAVDKAESESDLAYAINAEAPQILGEEAARIGAAVIHFSTDYVFAGDGTAPWKEDSLTGPLGVYGASKLAGEQALKASGASHVIFRTSWVYGATGKNFLLTILRLAREREQMNVVADQHGAPTWSRDLARLTTHTMQRAEALATATGKPLAEATQSFAGTYHACDGGETTWFGFAQEFLRIAQQAEPQSRFATLTPIATSEYPTPAKRPANSRMDCSKLEHRLGFIMPEWKRSVADVMNEVLSR